MTVEQEPDVPSACKRARSSISRRNETTGRVSFSNGDVAITFAQPEDHEQASRQELASMAAERQCRAHIAAYRPEEYSLKITGSFPSPAIEVTIQSSLLEKLPLLADMQRSTEGTKATDIELPCSIWDFVSLLILLTEKVRVDEWFTGNLDLLDERLPANTLTVADFMGCETVEENIRAWLRDAFHAVASCKQTNDKDKPPITLYLSKVLRHVPDDNFKSFVDVTQAQKPASLPLPLLKRWIASTGSVLDLRTHKFSTKQLFAIASGISMSPPDALKVLEVSADQEEQSSVLMLEALQAIVCHTTSLTTLGVQDLLMTEASVKAWEELVQHLPPTITDLHLSFSFEQRFGAKLCQQVFDAIARINSLKNLQLKRGWEHIRYIPPKGELDINALALRQLTNLKIFIPVEPDPKSQDYRFPSFLSVQKIQKTTPLSQQNTQVSHTPIFRVDQHSPDHGPLIL